MNSTPTFAIDKKKIRWEIIVLAAPIVLQNLVSSFLNLVDTFMIGKLGGTEIAAVGLANNLYFLFMLLLFGTNSGVSIFTAQFYGKGDYENMRKSIALSMLIGIGFASVFTILGVGLPKFFLGLFLKDPQVVSIGSNFLWITSISYIFTAISFSISFACRSVGKPRVPLIISSISLAVNTVIGFVLIFGLMGMPKLGVTGAAIATLIARLVEFTLIVRYMQQDDLLRVRIRDVLRPGLDFVRLVMKTVLPVIGNEFIWALGVVMYSAAFAKLGKDAVAAIQIGNAVLNFYSVVFFGLGNACAIMMGQEIGSKNFERAVVASKEIMKLSVYAALIISCVTILTAKPIVMFFNVGPEVLKNATLVLYISAAFNVFRVFNINMVVGILRSGGDTVYSFLMEMGSIWAYGVPLAFIGAIIFKLPVPMLYLVVCTEELVKSLFGFKRYMSKKWLNNLVEHVD